ncbi:hypothetical protein IW136_003722 [Coemansia sp. RSA 678]|nr:hypothetical protein IW136_003722 [Coemansia sp. RSA 678]
MSDSTPTDSKPAGSQTHPVFTRAQRKTCHAKRDAFFECLDANNIADPDKAGETCKDLRRIMYEKCPFEQMYVDRPE